MIILKIEIPNFPTSNVKCVIVDCNAPVSLFKYFDNHNISYVKSCYLKNNLDAVSTHPDMQICHIGGGDFVAEPTIYQYYKKHLEIYGVNVTKGKKIISSNYPEDISYNVVITENFLMHNQKYTDDIINKHVRSLDMSIYNVKQGYTKCATCIIDKNALITSDEGIYKICLQNGIDCLLVEKDTIKLGDRNDGFIGGCCGMIGYKTLLFCGDISAHKSYTEIMKFTERYNVKIVSSSNEVLTDVGSIIPVVQE